VHWHARPVGGDADVGDRWERRVLRAVVGLPRSDLVEQVRLGSPRECCHYQYRELQLALVPTTQRVLGQEPLAYLFQGHGVRQRRSARAVVLAVSA
jgi:hypothetical protein